MNGSVWYKEVDTALLTLIPTILTIGVTAIPVYITNPEREYVVSVYPSCSVSKHPEEFATARFNNVSEVVSTNPTEFTCEVEEPAKPYNLIYQINIWTEYLVDSDELTRKWQGKIGKDYVLTVEDTEGNTRYCKVKLRDVVNSPEGDEGEIMYHNIFIYEIWVELDEIPAETKSMITTVTINNTGNLDNA